MMQPALAGVCLLWPCVHSDPKRDSSQSRGRQSGILKPLLSTGPLVAGMALPLMGRQVSSSGSFPSLPGTMNMDWMSALCPQLWGVPIHHLSIPGSHDTMTYCLNKKPSISHDQSWLLQLLDKVLPCITRSVVMKWSATQTLNVTEQLDAGVQYLDLRIAHMLEGSKRNLHFVHLVYTTALVEEFRGHDRGPALVPGHLLPEHLWGHAVSLRGGADTASAMGTRPAGGLFVAGINLTENLAYILLHPSESLKTMTLPSLPYLSRWVQEQCPGLGTQCTNIIEGNFIGMDAFTSDVIWLNEKMLPC
ncbi:hypothetical protein MC885_005297 [Smutsia gigantea]|nr:hypothetical protein MC885_005297 [Smutsia gigantea]